VLREARDGSGLTLRALAERAGTSHSTLAAYEAARTSPTARTMFRIIDAAGYAIDFELAPRRRGGDRSLDRGDELRQVLELAEQFPARHSPEMTAPVFPRRPT
jgi:transcriptional regulator with XRE-family HTH domain